MNRDETQGGALIKYNSATVPHPSSRGMDWRRVGTGLPELMLNRRDLAHHTLLADDEEEEDGEGGLARRFVLSRGLASLDELMVCKETVRNGMEEEVKFRPLLPYNLPNPQHLHEFPDAGSSDNIKQEFKLSDAMLQIKQEGEELADFQKKKNRKQHPPAKILTINEDGSLGLQSAKPHVCEHCSSAFRTNYHLQRHAFIHTGEKPFQCSQCDMRFIQKYLLHRHEKIHTGEKPFRCDECGMKFIQKYHMERHKRTHSGEKPYQCTYCHQNFSRSDRVLKHQRMCHENRKTNEANAMDGPVVSEQDLGYSFPPKDCCQPKKKRQKVNERTRHPVNFPHKMEGGMGREDLGPGRSECLSLYSHVSRVKNEHVVTEYSVELPDLAVGGSRLAEAPPPEVIHSHKLALKKLASKKIQRQPAGQQDDLSSLSSFDDGKVARYTFQLVDKPGLPGTESHTDLNTADPRQGAASKPPASSTNYDDAMQFVKKRRYLQAGAPSSGRDYALNTGIAARTSVNRASGASSSNDAVPAFISHSHTMKTEAKSTQDKNILSNEVLQTLLDHYSNKASGQPEISFGVAGTEVTSSISIDSSDMSPGSHVEALGMNALAPPNGHSSVLQEYSRFLHQALERTSQNDSYLSTQSLNFTPKSRSLSNQPLFTAIDTHYTSSSRMRSGMNSPPRLSSAKDSHFGLLVGDSQHSFSFSGEETNPSSVSSTDDFLDQVAPPKKSDSQVLNPPFQMAAFEQNFQSQFQSSGSAVPSHFSFSTGAVNLHGHEGGTHFPEYPAANVTHTRTQPTALFDSRNL